MDNASTEETIGTTLDYSVLRGKRGVQGEKKLRAHSFGSEQDTHVCVLFFRLGAGGGAAIHTEIFVEVAIRKDQQEALTDRRRLPTLRAVERGRSKRLELLLRLCSSLRRPTGWIDGRPVARPTRREWAHRAKLYLGSVIDDKGVRASSTPWHSRQGSQRDGRADALR